jgi:hypothetical protein
MQSWVAGLGIAFVYVSASTAISGLQRFIKVVEAVPPPKSQQLADNSSPPVVQLAIADADDGDEYGYYVFNR